MSLARDALQTIWYATLVKRAIKTGAPLSHALAAADLALAEQPFPEETEIDKPDEQDEDWRDEAEPPGWSDGVPVDFTAAFSFDIFNRSAQGILNKAMAATKALSAEAREDLAKAAKLVDPGEMGYAIVRFIQRYRLKLANLLGATQLASLLEGARDVAKRVPYVPPVGAGMLPATLEPHEALALIERMRGLSVEDRERQIYDLSPDQQKYIRLALQVGPPEIPPTFTVPTIPSGEPDEVIFPTIENAARDLAKKNVVDRRTFDRLDDAARQKAFTVTGQLERETLQKIRDSLAENVKEGADYATWRKAILGAVDEGSFLSPLHMETVFRTNIQGAFSDGQMGVLRHPFVKGGFPYVVYSAIHDDRVEDTHLAMEKHGIGGSDVYRVDDPVFQEFRPPWRWNCRCAWAPITVRMAAEKGIKSAQEWLRTGLEPTVKDFVNPPPFKPPAGFQRAVEAAPLSIRLSLMSIEEFEDPEQQPDEMGQGATAVVNVTNDTAPEPPPPSKRAMKIRGRKGRGQKHRKRRLGRGLRIPKDWKAAFGWTAYKGDKGGTGWKDSSTGEVRYQEEKPRDSSDADALLKRMDQIEEMRKSAVPPIRPQTEEEIEQVQKYKRETETFFDILLEDSRASADKITRARADFRAVLAFTTSPMQSAIRKNLDGITLYETARAVTEALPRNVAKENIQCGGFYAFVPGERTGTLTVNGDYEGRPDTAKGIYAHELGHVIDGPDRRFSQNEEWQAAWKAEIVQAGDPLSGYAKTSPQEGFAEFSRLLLTGQYRDARDTFPRCYAFWKTKGLI